MSSCQIGGEVVAVGLANFTRWLDTVNFASQNGNDGKRGLDGITMAAVGLLAGGDEKNNSKPNKYKTEQVSQARNKVTIVNE